ncbi:amino acid transporter [Sporormia fimetaria CBS 119925]|uniref:Amino acid transporter n=1 Tax=Sporormia fimetaria CBS 119925 TaxID=1340428 RepID=A0A6A6VAV4_9PLEO|nr:amino acid transporter [Sporormia fimetaria CBS 119925]
MDDSASGRSANSSLDLEEEDRRYLEALRDRNHVATKTTRHPLGLFSVVAFILQQMIGTGIFRTPWTVMRATESVGVSLLFWFMGAITAVAGATLYIEFGLSLPRHLIDGKVEPVVRNGGDLNYVGYLVKRPKYLIYCIYGLNYILLASSAANAVSFGDDVMGGSGTDRSAAKDHAARGIAMVVVTLACCLHAFTRRGGILLNNFIVVLKILILCSIPIMAICALGGVSNTNHAKANMSPSNAFTDVHSDVDRYVQGTLAILYAYNGYNQANYVLCEINRPRKTLVKGIVIAVSIVCVLYMLVNLSYMIVVRKEDQLNELGPEVALQFLINIMGTRHGPRVFAAFTTVNSLGNIIGMTFAASRVKQEIAKEGVIPFAKFFGENRVLFRRRNRPSTSEAPHASPSANDTAEPTPYGALLLHWIFAMLLILATWPAKPANAYRILVALYSYVTDVIPSFMLGVGMLCLRFFTSWSSKSPVPGWLSISAAFLFMLTNGFPLVAIWVPPMSDQGSKIRIIPGWKWFMTPTLSAVFVTCSVLYWVGFRYVWPRFGARRGKEFVVEREPVFRIQNGVRVEWHEIVLHSWMVKGEPEGREGHAMRDI